ncbi:subtilisin-like protein, partial [Cryphonectria parasitica EP155]
SDVQLYFDFAGPPSVMMRMFKKTFEHVKFDPVLQYVAFPSVKVEEKVDDTSISRRSLGAGRRDMVQFFNWLRKDKKVTRIMKVIVDDSQQPAHSDEAIIEALRDFHVEELHWLKTDLDPITIRTASSEIRELKLRWSGSNATLRGWGEPDGLPKLENLSTLYIELVHELVSLSSTFSQNRKDRYAKKLKGAQQLASPVTVALIDDGVDLVDPSFQDRLYEGKSLSFDLIGENDPKTSQRVHSYHHSEGGHGTVMANLIFRVCPMAKLYIIRIETHRNREGQSRFVTRSAAEAIRAAIDKKVNIISMSWTVAMDLAKPSDDMKDLQSAVQAAHDAKVLMFCSSSDGGQFVEETLPASGNRDHVFRIGAASADGTPFSWAGPVEKLDYILPGVDVVKRRPGHGRGRLLKEKMEEMKSDTGSSVATALAAGLAAMVLTCVKMAAMHTASAPEQHKLGVTEDMVQQLQEHVKMKAALDNLDLTPNKYLQVWFKLNTSQISRGVRFSDSGESEKLERISNMVLTKGFVSKIT